MENLGDTIINGKKVNLEETNLEELNNYLTKVRKVKEMQKEKINNFLDEIYS